MGNVENTNSSSNHGVLDSLTEIETLLFAKCEKGEEWTEREMKLAKYCVKQRELQKAVEASKKEEDEIVPWIPKIPNSA